jgi:hypothetical protein
MIAYLAAGHPVAQCGDHPAHLVSENGGLPHAIVHLSVQDVHVGAADSHVGDLDLRLPRQRGFGSGLLDADLAATEVLG